jgi:hypothetical protein
MKLWDQNLKEYSIQALEVEIKRRIAPQIITNWARDEKKLADITEAAENWIRALVEDKANPGSREAFEYNIVNEVLVAMYGEDITEWVESRVHG